ncbi:hypothetical protein ABZW30_38295 [Kitasatospora sp. NPDC004669]
MAHESHDSIGHTLTAATIRPRWRARCSPPIR